MNIKEINYAPLLICFIWNAYLFIYAVIDEGLDKAKILDDILMGSIFFIILVFLPLWQIFKQFKSSSSGLVISGVLLFVITALIGWGYLSSSESSRVFLLGLNWVVLWLAAIMIMLSSRISNSK